MPKGKMFVDWWIQCGKCEHMEALAEEYRHAANATRDKRGWKLTRAYGWVCKDCYQEIQQKKASR